MVTHSKLTRPYEKPFWLFSAAKENSVENLSEKKKKESDLRMKSELLVKDEYRACIVKSSNFHLLKLITSFLHVVIVN